MDNEPFDGDAAHLRSELLRLDTLLRLQALRALRPSGNKPKSLEAIRALFACPPGDPPWRPIQGSAEAATLAAMFERQCASQKTRVAATLAAGRTLRLVTLAERCRLGGLEQSAVLLALAPELDARYELLYAFLQGDDVRARPSMQLALDLFEPDLAAKIAARERFADPQAPLRRLGLCRLVENPHRPS
ncbi:MAG TPA: hypothetical protein VK459_01565, partial [Polyangiaceae bacterium]|nr:hypothetical protein [Polyangiaceae bacterium]